MKIVTIDAKDWDVKYQKKGEKISNFFGTSSYDYPQYVGSKVYHNSTSSDKYNLVFYISENDLDNFKESFSKIFNPNKVYVHKFYKEIYRIIIEHPERGAIQGNVSGEVVYDTSKGGDVRISCNFIVHTTEEPLPKKDLETLNEEAFAEIDTETSDFDVDLSTQDKSVLSGFATKLQGLYSNIQNSSVVSAFNDINSELTKITLDSQRIMNAFKGILNLPNRILTDTRLRLNLLQSQADLIMDLSTNSANLTLFNTKTIAYNTGLASRSIFVSDSALQAQAGIKSVPMT